MSKEIYLTETIAQIPRLLGLVDRNINSSTYGCFDRQYWHYKTIDFPSARCQEGVLALALLFQNKGTVYFNQGYILNLINAGIDFWCRSQEKCGAFNEMFPKERSYIATAFSSYAISETALLLGKGHVNNFEKIIRHLKKAGSYLSKWEETSVFNQETGAILALYNIYLLCGDEHCKKSCEAKVESIYNNRRRWFLEYFGIDFGYLSLSVDFLAKYYEKSKDQRALEILKEAVLFLSHFMIPGFWAGGEIAARNTEYLIPSGFEIMAKHLPEAGIIAKYIREEMVKGTFISLSNYDDKYLSSYSYACLQAFKEGADDAELDARIPVPLQESSVYKYDCLEIIKNKDLILAYNFKKGGSLKCMFKNKKIMNDSGMAVELVNGKKYISSDFSEGNTLKEGVNIREIFGRFSYARQALLTPFRTMLSRFFILVLGWNDNFGHSAKKFLKSKYIYNRKKSSLRFKRSIILSDISLVIVDTIPVIPKKRIKRIILGFKGLFTYVPSADFFRISEIDSSPFIVEDNEIYKNKRDRISIKRTYDLYGQLKEWVIG